MNFINRAFKNVTRKLSKTILLTLTFFLIGNLVIIGLGISNASENAKILTRQKMRAVVTYRLDQDKIWQYAESITDEDELNEFYRNYPRIKLEEVKAFLDDDRVKTANSITNNMWYQDAEKTLDYVHLGNQAEQNIDESNGQSCWYENDVERCETYRQPLFFIKANMFPNMIEFEDGDYKIVDGRFYNQDEIDSAKLVCVISEALANTNNLRVGDSIKLGIANLGVYYQEMGISQEDVDVEFEVVGIYSHHNQITPDASNYDYISPYENPDNMIFMPTTSMTLANLPIAQKEFDRSAQEVAEWGDEETIAYYSDPNNRPSESNLMNNVYIENATLLLTDPLDVDKFVEDYKDTITEFTMLDANNEEFNRLAKPLDTLSMYAGFIVNLVVINAIVIITLVTALTLKTREYEIGVLLSIGASKLKVIGQFFVELALVAILGFSLSVVSGSLIAKQIGNTVLEYQISTSDVENGGEDNHYVMYGDYYDPWNSDYSDDVSLEDLVSEYEVNVSPAIIGEIYALGLGIVLISVLIPSFMIMRYNPKKILMNQN